MRHQVVQFTVADMATRVEVGAALCREAARQLEVGAPSAATYAAAGRLFARGTLAEIDAGGRLCTTGFLSNAEPDELAVAASVTSTLQDDVHPVQLAGAWNDMEVIAEALRTGDV